MKKILVLFTLLVQSLILGMSTGEMYDNVFATVNILPINLNKIVQNDNKIELDSKTRDNIFSALEMELHNSIVKYEEEFEKESDTPGMYGQFHYVAYEAINNSGGPIFIFEGKNITESRDFKSIESAEKKIGYYCSLIAYVHIAAYSYFGIELANGLEKYDRFEFEEAVILYTSDYMTNFLMKNNLK